MTRTPEQELEDKRGFRLLVTRALYERTHGVEGRHVDLPAIVAALPSPTAESDVTQAARYLEGERLVECDWAYDGLASLGLTHYGVVEVERSIKAPSRETEHFPSARTVHYTSISGGVTGSNIAVDSAQAVQTTGLAPEQAKQVAAIVERIEHALPDLGLSTAAASEIEAQIATVRDVLNAQTPDKSKLSRALGIMRAVLLGIGEHAVAAEIVHSLSNVM